MKILLLSALLGMAVAESSYGSTNGGFSSGFRSNVGAFRGDYPPPNGNGFGGSNGASKNGYSSSNGNSFSSGFGGFNGASKNVFAASPSNSYSAPRNGYGVDPEIVALSEDIPGGGVPGGDYPILSSVPDTGFSCDDQASPGYYADTAPEAGCQVFHICQDRALRRQQDSFLCPNGTIFNQQYLVCDWWFNFDCSAAENFFFVNELIGVEPKAGYGTSNGKGNGFGSNGYGSNGNRNINGAAGYGSNGNGNGNGSNGYGSSGNGNGNGANVYGTNANGNGRKNRIGKNGRNGNGRNGYGSNSNGGFNGNGVIAAPSTAYSAPSSAANAYGSSGAFANGNGFSADSANGYGSSGFSGNGLTTASSSSYGAPGASSNGFGSPSLPSEAYEAPY